MILLLDAHTLLWWLDDDATLEAAARAAIASPANDVVVSSATVWEIEIKRALGKLEAPVGLVDAIEASAFKGLPVSPEDAERAGRLPPHHRDPFDRMLVAQAIRLEAVIVSRDNAFAPYGRDVLRAWPPRCLERRGESSGAAPDAQAVAARVGEAELVHSPRHVGDRRDGKADR